jgi:HAP1 N-terminal conserved region
LDLSLCAEIVINAHRSSWTKGEANNHIKNLDDELAKKYDDMAHQKEEITSLLAQLVSQRHKIREVMIGAT